MTLDLSLTSQLSGSNAANVTTEGTRKSSQRHLIQKGATQRFVDRPHVLKKPHMCTTNIEAPFVLHVDDDVDLVDAVTSRLKSAGFRVGCALDGESGFQTAMLYRTDAIILDYDMPNGKGDEVIELLKANGRTKDIPIVVLTAVQQRHLKRRLLNMGADAFLSKPFEFENLKTTVSELIESNN